jgi:hypothetical protein
MDIPVLIPNFTAPIITDQWFPVKITDEMLTQLDAQFPDRKKEDRFKMQFIPEFSNGTCRYIFERTNIQTISGL